MNKLNLISLLAIVVIFSGCGGGGDSSSDTTPPSALQTVTGKFVDDPVQGLKYTCTSSLSGTTNIEGEYTCNVGDNVTFFIGDIKIGTVAAQTTIITPYVLFPNDNTASLNLARLLQSLNSGSTSNKIVLNSSDIAKIPSNINFKDNAFETVAENALGRPLVSAQVAQDSMNDSIVSFGGTVPTNLNHIPVANSGINQNINTSSLVTLNGSASSDADSDSLTYTWSITSAPTNSNATLSDTTVVNPIFTADLDGAYVLSLVVNDGTVNSVSDTVTINATTDLLYHIDSTTSLKWADLNQSSGKSVQSAYSYCSNLVIGNEVNWRLPSISELESTIGDNNWEPAVKDGFRLIKAYVDYWSVTSIGSNYYSMDYHNDGHTNTTTFDTNQYNVLCVSY